MNKFRVSIIVLVVLIAALFLVNSILKMSVPEPEKIVIADAQQPVFSLLYVADKLGYFKDEGLEVSYKKFIFGKDGLADVVAGGSDIATVYESPVVRKVYEGEQLAAISTLHVSKRNTAVIGLKDRGIFKAEDLKGKRIAVPKGTNAEIFLYSLLLITEIDLADVTVVDMLPDEMEKAMREGKIDGVSLFNPYLDRVEHAFDQAEISIIYSDTYTEMSLLVGKRDYVIKNSSRLTKLLKAIVRAEEFTRENPEEAIKIVDSWLPNFTTEEIRRQWLAFDKTAILNNTLLTILSREAQFYRDAGFYQTPVPGFRDLIFTNYLKEVKPEAVTIY